MLTTADAISATSRDAPVSLHRRKALAQALAALRPHLYYGDVEPAAFGRMCEAIVWALEPRSALRYGRMAHTLVFHLREGGASLLRQCGGVVRICTRSSAALRAFMQHSQRDDAAHTAARRLLEDAALQSQALAALASTVHVSAALRCPQCNVQDGIARMAVQMNAGDEGMRTRCLCFNCKHTWTTA